MEKDSEIAGVDHYRDLLILYLMYTDDVDSGFKGLFLKGTFWIRVCCI